MTRDQYEAVIRDLQAKRDAIDAAIHAIRMVLGGVTVEVNPQSNGGGPRANSAGRRILNYLAAHPDGPFAAEMNKELIRPGEPRQTWHVTLLRLVRSGRVSRDDRGRLWLPEPQKEPATTAAAP